jgi:chromosome partitioning protein
VISHIINQLREGKANAAIDIQGIVMTMYDARTRLSPDVVAEVRKHFGDKVYATVIPRNIRLSEAPSFGRPVIQYDSHCAGSVAYRELAREVIARELHEHPQPQPQP